TPQVAAAVVYFRGEGSAAGTESLDGVGGMRQFSGGAYPGRTWTAFMETTLSRQPQLEFPEPARVGQDRRDFDRRERDEREERRDDREDREERDRERSEQTPRPRPSPPRDDRPDEPEE